MRLPLPAFLNLHQESNVSFIQVGFQMLSLRNLSLIRRLILGVSNILRFSKIYYSGTVKLFCKLAQFSFVKIPSKPYGFIQFLPKSENVYFIVTAVKND